MIWVLVCTALAAAIYFYLIKPLTYWSRKGAPQRSFLKLLLCIIRSYLQLDVPANAIKAFYDDFPDKSYNGAFLFTNPVLILRDPEVIKQITVKDFDHFVDRSEFVSEELDELWGKNLVSLKGDRWRDMRAILSPTFTSSKMKAMFGLMNECAEQFVDYFKKKKNTETIEMKDAFSRLANDVIASTAFGVSCNSLTSRDNEFYLMAKKAIIFRGFWKNMKFLLMMMFPALAKLLGLKFISAEVSNFFRRLVKTNIELREKNGIIRPDMIHLLMEARNGRLQHDDQDGAVDDGFAVARDSRAIKQERRQKQQLTDDDLVAQVLIFFLAGFETVSTLMCFIIYELVVNPDIQETLRKDIDETLESFGGAITYDSILKMKYLDMVVSEVLRKWPGAIAIDRICVKPYTIQPIMKGELPIHVSKGDVLLVPIFGVHRSIKFYPNPEKFDPERFSNANEDKINPYAYMPFGVGPRNCIGNRFALLEMKIIVFHILANFEVVVTERTEIPVSLAKDQFNLHAKNGFWFGLKPRKK